MIFKRKALAISCSLFTLSTTMPVSAQEVEWSIETGLGYESNVYHAPDHDYEDFFPTPSVIVTPEEIGSFFIPVEAQVAIRNKVYDNTDFVAGLDFDTDVMLNSDADDATRTEVRLDLGFDYDLIEWKYSKKKKDYIKKDRGNAYLGAFFSSHSQVYVDRDTGLPKTLGIEDVSDKYSYQSVGVEGDYKRKVGKYTYYIDFTYQDLNYEAPPVGAGSEYDHKFTELGFDVKRDFSKAVDLKIGYIYSARDYSDRNSRNLQGQLFASSPFLKYTYNSIEATVSHKISKKLKTYYKYVLTQRTDEHLGYNDYARNEISVRVRYKYTGKTKVRTKLAYSTTDYDRAYDFENDTLGIKENSGADLDVKVEHEVNKHKLYYVELNYTDRVSTDDRYDYTNNVIMLGAKWEY